MKLKKLVCAVMCVAALGVATSANAAKDPKDIKIGFSVPQLANPWFVGVKLGMEEACKELGIQCIAIDAQYRLDKQLSDLENMITDKYDAIFTTAIDANALQATFADAKSQGIVTGSIAQTVPNSDLLYGMDEYAYGHAIGTQAANWAKSTLKCKGKVALITQDNVEAVKRRGDGIEDAIKEICPDLELVARQAGDNPERGMRVIESVLQRHPDLNLVVATNDSGGIGGYQAMDANGIKGDNYAVFSGDATREALALIEQEGSIYRGTVDLYPFKGGYESTKIMYDMIQNGIPKEQTVRMLPYVEVPQADVMSGKYKATY